MQTIEPTRSVKLAGSPAGWSRSERQAGPRISELLPFGMVAIWLLGLAYFWNAGTAHDPSWYLSATRAWLFDGAELYTDIIEINPPLAFYVIAPAVWASATFGISANLALNLYLVLLAAGSSALVLWIVREAGECSVSFRCAYVLAATFIALFGALPDQGQREHFLVLFALPYLTAGAFRPLGLHLSAPRRCAIAAIACLGLFLKPYFLLAPAAVSLAECWQERSIKPLFRAENWTIGLLAIAYVAFVALAHPAYLSDVVPLGRATYAAYAWPSEAKRAVYLGLLLAVPAILPLLRRSELAGLQRTAAVLLLIMLAFLLSFLLQDRGWSYQRIPMKAFAALSGVALLAALLRLRPSRPLAVAGGAVTAVLVPVLFLAPGRFSDQMATDLHVHLGSRLTKERVLGFSIFIEAYFPFVTEADARWVGRYPCLWPLRAAATMARSDDPDERRKADEILARLRREVTEDLRRKKPAYVLSERRFAPGGMDYVSFFREEPGFAAEWANYRLVESFGIFEVWRREGT